MISFFERPVPFRRLKQAPESVGMAGAATAK